VLRGGAQSHGNNNHGGEESETIAEDLVEPNKCTTTPTLILLIQRRLSFYKLKKGMTPWNFVAHFSDNATCVIASLLLFKILREKKSKQSCQV
jgi:hypothetical protein